MISVGAPCETNSEGCELMVLRRSADDPAWSVSSPICFDQTCIIAVWVGKRSRGKRRWRKLFGTGSASGTGRHGPSNGRRLAHELQWMSNHGNRHRGTGPDGREHGAAP